MITPRRLVTAYLAKHQGRVKTAGEVRFIKDRGGDDKNWAFGQVGPEMRQITPDYAYAPNHVKKLAKCLRATTAALGHAMSAYHDFAKIKSAQVSPDGSLGGKGYIQRISDMRRAYMNVVEALSALSDTIYDEVQAPHWSAISRQKDDESKQEVTEIVQDAEQIRRDPEQWAEQSLDNQFGDAEDDD